MERREKKKKIVIAFLCVASKLFFPSSSCFPPHHNRIFSYFFMSIFFPLFIYFSRSIVIVVNVLTFKWGLCRLLCQIDFFYLHFFFAIIFLSLQSRYARNLSTMEWRREIKTDIELLRLIYCRWYLNWIGQI